MADNTTLNTGSGGDVIASDDISGVKYQRVKVTFGSDGTATDVDETHRLPVLQRCATSTGSNVASSASSVQLLAANANRIGATLFNDSTAIAYVKFGTTASTSDYKVQIPAGGYYEFPLPISPARIDAIWSSANGNMRIVEDT